MVRLLTQCGGSEIKYATCGTLTRWHQTLPVDQQLNVKSAPQTIRMNLKRR